jgi:HlyD family secretion protein
MNKVLDNMDRVIAPEKIRKRKIITITVVSVVLLVVAFSCFALYTFIKPDLKRSQIKIAKVERANIFSSISASGLVEAEYMNTLIAPFSGKILNIRKPSGSRVLKGDTILILDQGSVREQLKNLEDQVALNVNSFRQSNLNVENQQLELEYQLEVKKMKISDLETSLSEEEQLLAVGGTSEEKIRSTRQQLDLAKRELELAIKQNKIRVEKIEAEQEALDLSIKIKKRELAKGKQLFDDAFVIAPENGVIIMINGREGQTISSGQEMVSISDLSTFKLTGKIADSNAEKLHPNGKVIAISNNTRLEGTIGNIRPEVENGMIKFDVFLEQNNHPDLRPNLSMELQIITAEKINVLRLPDGPFFDGSRQLDVFRVEGNKAYKTRIKAGLNNFEYVEIESGLKEGDEVIISDVSKVIHLETIKLRQ